MYPLLIVAAALYGALAGTLLVTPGYRLAVPEGEPWRATCPAGHPLPGGAWIGRLRCASCPGGRVAAGAARSAAVLACCCAALAAAVGPRPELAVWLLAAPVVVLLAVVDLAVQRLPDVLTLPLALALAGGLGLAAAVPGAAGSWPRALLAGPVLGAVYLVLFLVNPAGLGFGDVKLAVPVGVALGWYGWEAVLLGTFAGFLLAAGYGLALVLAGRAGRRTPVPFGPCIALGALAAVLAGGLTV
ncbi:prepilin peptidase [Streptomyces hoynatensis]|uniref:Prepilin peptidase n=1 Tax=Streptomyces hoynatensis TaxID=1141874 RepID=A0A3A9ZF26_9ACTN|nr:A24 family peptidase [Streptomyces hoynatensis]RKN46991.1 prepilin peptidase [Streptomyces hoynatensis]